ncbi:MAG: M23 family peptidase [Lachnospiraceae bacterium]|nr:M23 family peptidase [Lachnospiraceae bacterium]
MKASTSWVKGRKADMRRNRKNSIKKERIIMLVSSAFVLTALTMTGIYMKNNNKEAQDDGYTLDFTAMEDNADNKFEEIAQNKQDTEQIAQNEQNTKQIAQNQTGNTTLDNIGEAIQEEVTEDDLDYMPLEAGSALVEIPGVTNLAEDLVENEAELGESAVSEEVLSFAEGDALLRPVSGEILMSYSMDKSIYFATLDQYKYNPAVIFSAAEGTEVVVCAEAQVAQIFEDEEIGNAVTLDLGDGYQVTYGQLSEINVSEGEYVDAGDSLGIVAAPTKYYSIEGSNLYFEMTKDGVSVNPEGMLQ